MGNAMRTAKGSAVSLQHVISVLGVVALILGMLTVPSRALAEGDCGPRGGLGKPGCGPPTPNPSPVVLRGGQPGSTQRTAITIVLERGESLGQSSPGTPGKPGGVNIFIRTDSQPERQTTPEDAGYFLFIKDPMPDGGQLLVYQRLDQQQPNPPSRQDPFTEIQVLLVPIAPEPPSAPTNPQIRNWRTTRVNVLYEARQAAVNLIQRIGLPGVGLHTNPAAGLTNLPSWFWASVDQGQLDPAGSLTIPYPWITTWQEEVQVCDSHQVPGTDPPVIDRQCHNEWQDGSESGTDYATISAQLAAASFTRFFGDQRYETYGPSVGMGRASRDISAPSPVRHTYTRSSLQELGDGGYLVQLYATWSAAYSVTTSTGQSESFTIPVARSNVYSARHQVRESQAALGRVEGGGE